VYRRQLQCPAKSACTQGDNGGTEMAPEERTARYHARPPSPPLRERSQNPPNERREGVRHAGFASAPRRCDAQAPAEVMMTLNARQEDAQTFLESATSLVRSERSRRVLPDVKRGVRMSPFFSVSAYALKPQV